MKQSKRIFLLCGDIVCAVLAFTGMIAIRFSQDFWGYAQIHAQAFLIVFTCWIGIFYIFNLYEDKNIRPTVLTLRQLVLALAVSSAVSISLFYLIPAFSIAPKTNLAITIALFGIFFVLWRRLAHTILSEFFFDKTGILGTRPEALQIYKTCSERSHVGIWAVCITNDLSELLEQKNIHKITRVIIARDITTEELHILAKNGLTGIPLLDVYELLFEKIPTNLVTDELAITILGREKTLSYQILSRLLDISVSMVVLILTLPITILTAIIILVQDGLPVLYTQTRVSKNNRPFIFYKFRSMIKNAESTTGAVWAQIRDPRITRFGQTLRTLHIDEIPQLWNVLRGDQSLVGPRSERPEFVSKLEEEIPYYFLRHTVKPGFTGWAQIKYRYARTIDESREKFEYDLYYLKNRNFIMDTGIILKTVQIIFTH